MTSEWMWRVGEFAVGTTAAVVVSYFAAQGVVNERLTALEIKQAAQYQQIMQRIDDLRGDTASFRADVKSDMNGTRAEIMGIMRELKR